ncbi:LysR family transcriptional regulator [Pseudoalteromonas tunicata]|jgi:DNA-binding transcriptional LysR family regulator|uniref:Transcriptional regulator, LysR family protein n=1 Tax=Pseudoalteromonas tunicata D2 TaxID=87626 RepID=A4C5B1_9GAMM|nr:LysR family transcriptional regulator [Pseudoalteromonas tunicata]ATC96784.1 hypothetical protein PTUN_b0388 [Pseudoalteromonas tunicata]AXT32931.1 LysR family transcriptional regulator [Pseudoalteromonas tunicata]EAR30743.1 transcriptional regulator, LysR family protein [Pseudoalteromonas tunicata D2]MDP4984313.1 LysR family transcriptional regulator [Pseudoalteromonas tunicata]MDP5214723.1 LysR family transcriptional regulator [Pseudoalteromonas tunicata]
MSHFSWDDIKIAHQAAKLGSLSKAAEFYGINYSTVLRRIEQLEKALECKLFLRHQRGYQLTDAGRQLLAFMPDIETRFHHFQSSLTQHKSEINGTLKITTLPEYSSFLHAILLKCQQLYPKLRLLVDVSNDIVKLESGGAHISIRAGKGTDIQADLIANAICPLTYSYYAAESYITRRGLPESEAQFNEHTWVMPSGRKQSLSFVRDIYPLLATQSISYQSNHFFDIQSAIEHGIGIGPIDDAKVIKGSGLQRVNTIICKNENFLWFVYHKDLRDDVKVQAVAKLIKQDFNGLEG